MPWKHESAGDRVVKQLQVWMRKQHNELEDDIQTALGYVDSLEGKELKVLLKEMKRRISVRRRYINSNFGVNGPLTISRYREMHPKPDLITGKEKGK